MRSRPTFQPSRGFVLCGLYEPRGTRIGIAAPFPVDAMPLPTGFEDRSATGADFLSTLAERTKLNRKVDRILVGTLGVDLFDRDRI
jgi:hypothetical protein